MQSLGRHAGWRDTFSWYTPVQFLERGDLPFLEEIILRVINSKDTDRPKLDAGEMFENKLCCDGVE